MAGPWFVDAGGRRAGAAAGRRRRAGDMADADAVAALDGRLSGHRQ